MKQERNAHGSRAVVAVAVLGLCLVGWFLVQKDGRGGSRAAEPQAQSPAGSVANAATIPPQIHSADVPVAATLNTNTGIGQSPVDAFEHYRTAVLQSHYGTNRIEDLLQALVETPGGPEIQLLFQALALRKQEAIPIMKARLRTGGMWEKHMLTKFLRLCPWSETRDELLALAQSETEHWLPRQDAVFALGALGDASAGPSVIAVLNSPQATINLQMAAVSTLSRIQSPDAAAVITPFTQAENIHLRLFATRALAELGETVDQGFLLSCLQSDDYVVRQEASETLWRIDGQDVSDALKAVAKGDSNEAVRDAASQALLRRDLTRRSPAEKTEILRRSLESTERLTALWILRTALEEGGIEGRLFVQAVAARDDLLGERSRVYLVLADSRAR